MDQNILESIGNLNGMIRDSPRSQSVASFSPMERY